MLLNVLSDTEDDTLSEMRDLHGTAPFTSEETWEAVEEEDDEDDEEGGGVLIVPPVTSPLFGPADQSTPTAFEHEDFELSVPGSVPSVFESIHVQNSTAVFRTTVESKPLEHVNVKTANEEQIVVICLHPRFPITFRRNTLLLTALCILLFMSLVANTTLWHDRSSLRRDMLKLKRDLLDTREKLDRKQSWYSSIKPEPVEILHKPLPPPPTCHCNETQSKNTNLVDNCWIQANANFQFGRCVDDAKSVVQDQFFFFNRGLTTLKHKLHHFVSDLVAEEPSDSNSSSPSKDEGFGLSFQGFKNAAAVLVSSVAFAGVASQVLEGTLSHVFDHSSSNEQTTTRP